MTMPDERLVDLMGDRGRELPHGRDAVGVRQLHLHLAVAPLALAGFLLRALALGQIEHEGDALVPAFLRTLPRRSARARGCRPCGRYSFSNGCTRPVVLSSGTARSSRSRHSGGVRSVQRRRPATRSSRSYPTMREKRVIGLENLTVEIPDEDPDDVGVDQASDLRFAFGEIAVQAGILERDRGLRGKQLQHRDAGRREDARRQVVLEVEHADELGLVEQAAGRELNEPGAARMYGSAENGFCVAASSRITLSCVRRT